jgi:hypothetical protein
MGAETAVFPPIRNWGHLLGWVKAANVEAAEVAAAKTFNLND